MAILLRRLDLALDNWWMYNSAFSERTPFGRAGQGLQEVVVDVLHCLVVWDITANGEEFQNQDLDNCKILCRFKY